MITSKPSFLDTFFTCLVLIALACLAPQKIFSAPLLITKPDYTLTYPDGWAITSLGINSDTTYSLLNVLAGFSVGGGTAFRVESGKSLGDYADTYSTLLGGNFSRSDSTSKTIGANSFMIVIYSDANDISKKIKVYAATKGDFAFVSYIYYPVAQETILTAQKESALATLKILASTGNLRMQKNKQRKNFNQVPITHQEYDLSGRRFLRFSSQVLFFSP